MDKHKWPNPEGDHRPLFWVTEASTNASEASMRVEILRLAEEVERLKGLVGDLETADETLFSRGLEEGERAERARIRRGLEAELLAWTEGAAPNSLRAEVARSMGAVLKRVCPE